MATAGGLGGTIGPEGGPACAAPLAPGGQRMESAGEHCRKAVEKFGAIPARAAAAVGNGGPKKATGGYRPDGVTGTLMRCRSTSPRGGPGVYYFRIAAGGGGGAGALRGAQCPLPINYTTVKGAARQQPLGGPY